MSNDFDEEDDRHFVRKFKAERRKLNHEWSQAIKRANQRNGSVGRKMSGLIEWASGQYPDPVWDLAAGLDYTRGAEAMIRWADKVMHRGIEAELADYSTLTFRIFEGDYLGDFGYGMEFWCSRPASDGHLWPQPRILLLLKLSEIVRNREGRDGELDRPVEIFQRFIPLTYGIFLISHLTEQRPNLVSHCKGNKVIELEALERFVCVGHVRQGRFVRRRNPLDLIYGSA